MTPLVLDLPGSGLWQARNSPARRVPSHGTTRFGTSYAIDLVPVDERHRSAKPSWRTLLTTEPLSSFVGFGRPVLAPVTGTVVEALDGQADHDAVRSPLAYFAYALGQARRIRTGIAAVAGNHVVIEVSPAGPYVLVAHLRHGSLAVSAGQRVEVGELIGACGNTGNSTQPHVHLQAVDSLDWDHTQAVPIVFRSYRSIPGGILTQDALPGEAETISRG
jgi:hypothetical protein